MAGAILARSSVLGIAKEASNGVYLVPTYGVPFTKAAWKDVIAPSRDESVRGNDSVVQGQYQGPIDTDWDITMSVYPDLAGVLLRGMIGPDTVTPGVSTTLTAGSAAGANSITVGAAIATGSVIMIDTGANIEYATTGTQTGTAPNLVTPLTSTGTGTTLALTHASGAAVVSQALHTFKQSPTTPLPTYSLTVWDGLQTLGYSYGRFTDLAIKIDPKSAVSVQAKMLTLPWTPQSNVTETFTAAAPFQGWSWTTTQAGTASTRGLTYDVTLKRAGETIHSSMGQQAGRENFVAALEADGTYKSIFDSLTDLNVYQQNLQNPFVVGLKTPLALGGAALNLTMSQAGWSQGVRDYSSNYIQATFALTGIQNSTDSGITSATLNNWVQTAY
jgi:hypothetical protein